MSFSARLMEDLKTARLEEERSGYFQDEWVYRETLEPALS